MTKSRYTKDIRRVCSRILTLLVFALAPLTVLAQNITVTGRVSDSENNAVMGASVVVDGTTIGALTNLEGEYTINAPSDGTLIFSFLGYETVFEEVGGRTRINVVLGDDVNVIDDVVVVGYGTQRRVNLTGAVSGIKGDQMVKTKNENPQNMLTGKVPGLRVWQKSAEPGTYNNNFDIRGLGSPLVIIDGITRTMADFQRINPQDIDDISILKDGSAAIYGVRAANGVLLVTTKKGNTSGGATVNYTGSFTFQKPSGFPKVVGAEDAMTLFNEMSMNNVNGGNITYTEADFEAYRNGTRRTTDWTSLLFSDWSPQTQHDVSITGGNENTQYYIGMGYYYQEGFFKSGDLNYNKYNLRANITTKIAKGVKIDLGISGVADERHTPYNSTHQIIRAYWRQGVLFPAYADAENTMLNYDGLEEQENPVAWIYSDVSGYRKYKQKYFQSSVALNVDFGEYTPVLQGLSAKGLFSFDYRQDDNTLFQKEYNQYAWDEATGTYDERVFAKSTPNQLRRDNYSKQQSFSQFILNYDRGFGRHKVSGLVGWEIQKRIADNYYAQRDLAFATDYLFAGIDENQMSGMSTSFGNFHEETMNSLIGRANYSFDDRYLAEVQFRYDGSSRFAKGHRWGFFPSASVGWRLSEEAFIKDTPELSFINQLKLRASYGVLGDDLGGDWNYEWAGGYTYPATNSNSGSGYYNQWAPGYIFNGQYVTALDVKPIENQSLTWLESMTFNVGIDFEGWNGLFGFSFDYFNRYRKGLYQRALGELPTVVGLTAPLENVNTDRHFGIELELNHRNRIGDFFYRVRAIGAVTRHKYGTAVQNGPYSNSYDRWKNDNLNHRYQGVQFGFKSAGRYTSWQDIWSYQIQKGRDILPGDYKYVDWNGDGEINDLDQHPYAFDQTPWLNYSLNLDLSYKNFDLNILFQGSALGSMMYEEPLRAIWGSNGGGTLSQFLDRWRPADPTADPYDPATQWYSGHYAMLGHWARNNSEFNRVSTAYLRLKSVELGYTLPHIKSMPSLNLRVFANAYNLVTWTGVKFVDPEHPEDEGGRLYPLNKTFTLGLSFTF